MKFRTARRTTWCPPRHRGLVVGRSPLVVRLVVRLDLVVVFAYQPFAGWFPVSILDHLVAGRVLRRFATPKELPVKKRTPALSNPESSSPHLAAMESVVFSKLHAIVKQCAITRYDDGDARTPGSCFISTQGSMWRVTVTEPDSCLKLTMMAQTLDDALAGITLALESESIPWELDAYAASRAKAKKK